MGNTRQQLPAPLRGSISPSPTREASGTPDAATPGDGGAAPGGRVLASPVLSTDIGDSIYLENPTLKVMGIIALCASFLLALHFFADPLPATAAKGEVTQKVKRPCRTVTPQTFNKRVKILDKITGKRHHRASRKVCKSHFRKLLKKIRAARTTCKARARIGIASVYGPEFGDGTQTASGARLTSETIGVAHKTLPFWNRFYFYFRGRVVRAPVVDRGPFIAGRDWDLTGALMRALKFPFGVAAVTTSKTNCWASA